MKIVHLCMCDPYGDDLAYHTNMLSRQNKRDGHDVTVICTPLEMKADGSSVRVESGSKIDSDGIHVIRLKDSLSWLPLVLSERLRFYKGMYANLQAKSPDIIFSHNFQFPGLFDVVKYKKRNPKTIVFVDNHGDYANSAHHWYTKYLFSMGYYRLIIRRCYRYIDYMYCTTENALDFFNEATGIKLTERNLYYQGGDVISPEKKATVKSSVKQEFDMPESGVLVMHSGKMAKTKKSYDVVTSFIKYAGLDDRLILIGSMTDEVKATLMPQIEADERILYLGWKKAEELWRYLAAADLYVQPGTQSITLQHALCNATPAICIDTPDYRRYCPNGMWFLNEKATVDTVLKCIFSEDSPIKYLNQKSIVVQKEAYPVLDNKILAQKLYGQ